MTQTSQKITADSSKVFLSRLAALLASLMLAVLVARLLGPAGRGEFALAFLLPTMILLFCEGGIESTSIYFGARREFDRPVLLGGMLTLSALAGTGGLLVGLAVAPVFGQRLFPGVATSVLLIAVAIIPGRVFLGLGRGLLLGRGKTGKYCWLTVLQPVFWLAAVVALVALLGATVAIIMIAIFLSFTAAGMVALFWTWQEYGSAGRPRLERDFLRQALSYGLRLNPAVVLNFLNYRVDLLLLGLLRHDVEVGFYAVAVAIAEKLLLFSRSVSTALFSSLSGGLTDSERSQLTAKTTRRLLLLLLVPAGLLWLLTPPGIVLLFGREFAPAAAALRALLPGVVMLGGAQLIAVDAMARGRPGLNSWSGAAAVVANILLNLWWIPRFGIVGAAWASTISYTMMFTVRLALFLRISQMPWRAILLPRFSDLRMGRKHGMALARKLRHPTAKANDRTNHKP